MLILKQRKGFKKDAKRAKSRGKDLLKLKEIVDQLIKKEPLDPKVNDHSLSGNYTGFRECQIEPDWLLIYYVDYKKNVLILARTGSHADLFNK